MTDEEIKQQIEFITISLVGLDGVQRPFTREESRRRHILVLEMAVLRQISKARESHDRHQEFTSTVTYGLLKSVGEKHPFLMHLIRTNLGPELHLL